MIARDDVRTDAAVRLSDGRHGENEGETTKEREDNLSRLGYKHGGGIWRRGTDSTLGRDLIGVCERDRREVTDLDA